MNGWQVATQTPAIVIFVIATTLGSLAGRIIGPHLPHVVIINTVRVNSTFACILLYSFINTDLAHE